MSGSGVADLYYYIYKTIKLYKSGVATSQGSMILLVDDVTRTALGTVADGHEMSPVVWRGILIRSATSRAGLGLVENESD